MVVRRENNGVMRSEQTSSPMVASASPKRAFSFKDAVVRSPPASATLSSRDSHPTHSRHGEASDIGGSGSEKKAACSRTKMFRSCSITKIVESPSFKKRCEALKSHHVRKHHDKKCDANLCRSPSGPSSDCQSFAKSGKLTPLEELCEREKRLHAAGANESFKSHKRSNGRRSAACASPLRLQADSTSETESSDTQEGPRKRTMSTDPTLLRRTSLPASLASESDAEGSACSSLSSEGFPMKKEARSQLKNDGKKGRGRCVSSSVVCSPPRKQTFKLNDHGANSAMNSLSPPPSASSGQDSISSDESALTDDFAVRCSTVRNSSQRSKVLDGDDDFSELDCEDTNSESTAESSCPSPRHSPITHFDSQHRSDLGEMAIHRSLEASHEHDELSGVLSHDEEEDEEAFLLLDRMNSLSAEFVANREYEESNALSWSVQHATQQGVISSQMQQNLYANINLGSLDEARDVLYHKCHLVPAVGSVVESPTQAVMDPSAVHSFVEFVDEISPTDAPEARLRKLQVLKKLSDLLTKWVKVVGHERGLSEEHIALTSGSLFLAGSYRLGLDDPNSDIDAVCVVPWHVTHDDFFGSFCKLLEHAKGVSHLAPVPNAYVPLISLSFRGVRMDLLFARLPVSSVEANQEIDSDHILVGVHEASMKSLNAPRVSSMLMCLVPKRREFRIVLRAVRAWARRRGIYSAKLGYLGGISWAILVAFVCQLYPNAEPAKIFVRFFQVLSEWQWPQPVMLNMIYDAGMGFDMWDPRQNLYDRSHIMPIITPAYPHMNSSVQVSQSTFSVIYEELWRARYLAEIAVGISKPFSAASSTSETSEADMKAAVVCMATSVPSLEDTHTALQSTESDTAEDQSTTGACPWDKLFQPSNFFIRYGSYMAFNFQADSESAMHKWGKFVQSRLRKLVDNLQHVSPVSRVHAFPCYFPHTSDRIRQGPGSCMFIGIEFHYRRHQTVQPKDDPEVMKTLEQTIRFFLATDLQQMEDKQPDMLAEASVMTWEELPEFVFPFGRSNAEFERAKYTDDLEKMGFSQSNTPSFRPPYYVNSYSRNGKWRNGPRKYAGGQRKNQRRDFRNAPRSYPGTQAG
ncbi:hypothetical protein BBJ28_00021810 [Nothophytophthora sp. Chile5]|nr:hypothetical protein BBJ28_00021810 [Nothophytophthora sp. Chile5]